MYLYRTTNKGGIRYLRLRPPQPKSYHCQHSNIQQQNKNQLQNALHTIAVKAFEKGPESASFGKLHQIFIFSVI